MKNICKIITSLVFMLTISMFVFAQSNPPVDKINNIPVNELYRGNIQLPSDFPVTSAKFFNIITQSLTQVTVNLLNENQVMQWKIVINYNPSNKTVEYKIFDQNLNIQWVKVTYSIENGKEVTNATSSSDKIMKVITSRGQIISECPSKVPVSEIEIIVNNQTPKKISEAEFQTQKGKAYLPLLLQETEEVFYDSSQLKVLQNVVFFLDKLQSLVMEKSLNENSSELLGIPKCNIFCVRIGTVIPIYVCNDYTLNCTRCGINGVYLLGGFGCFAICSIPCGAFWVYA